MKQASLIIGIVIIAAAGFFLWQRSRGQLSFPQGETRRDAIKVQSEQAGESESKEIMITDNVKHSVPLDEIKGGGPPKDGIPSIDEPKFISIVEAGSWLKDDEPGIAFSRGGTHRFYPYQILVWHEIVNDTVPASTSGGEGERALVTYCPLCFSGIVFDPLVSGERVEFGTSGKLWNSNLVMYDRKTESLWSQILGEAIVGEMTGTRLSVLPSDITRFGEWKKKYPNGEVLFRDTGAFRSYGSDPYGDYYTSDAIYFPVNARDDRLHAKAFVFGLVTNGKAKAYFVDAVKAEGEITDTFEGNTIVAQYNQELDVVQLFKKKSDGVLERLNPFPTYWFSWVAAHPDTELFK